MARKKKLKKRNDSDRRTKERRAIPPEQSVGYNPNDELKELNSKSTKGKKNAAK